MDGVPGWHAYWRAQKEDEWSAFRSPEHGDIGPMQENFIGGLRVPPNWVQPPPPSSYGPLPPSGDYRRYGEYNGMPSASSGPPGAWASMSAPERSNILRAPRMEPHLQFMVGPLLRYDTVDEHGVWHGAVLIVTADSGSVYEPLPILTYEYDPAGGAHHSNSYQSTSSSLGPHPSDPHSVAFHPSPDHTGFSSMKPFQEPVPGQEIHVYNGHAGTFTFWRFLIQIPLGPREMAVTYHINSGLRLEFFVPGRNQNMRWAAFSCNGFSAGINPDDFRGPGFESGYDPVWTDLLAHHARTPFHALVGGGDQLYCDSLMRERELQHWASLKPEERKVYPLTDEISAAIERFFFNHYCQCFRRGAFARANSSIPMMNMCDDHDLIDGFGSYPHDLQTAPVFQTIGTRGYFYFLLFQCFINPHLDGVMDASGRHVSKSVIIGEEGPYVRWRSHSFLAPLGPQCSILLLDCRAERRKDQVCSARQYQKIFARLSQLPSNVEHLVILTGIPVAYPRMVLLETALESKLNPLVALGRTGSLGLSGFVNKFNADAELLDDLNDHWTARSHKAERNWLIEQLQLLARAQRIRVSFLSGDVHCAAVGVLKTLKGRNQAEIFPRNDYRYMINVVTSAIVNTPPPIPVIKLVSTLATKVHKTMHHVETDETMWPVFETDPDGSTRKQKYIMARRNWCHISWDSSTGELIFDIRVEREKGVGDTVGYMVKAPAPSWPRRS